ncbi:hypothetical protein OsI_30305 [Oryza sativa Indica Group]|uniref:Uncharacterized protein n=1 Tax=Oryza sativa subsp. indica TaxID=39946 RepID=B8B9L9_ORYSI|nr:hypothetical protein OsI_30305 [Oryza sativa Indica Group]
MSAIAMNGEATTGKMREREGDEERFMDPRVPRTRCGDGDGEKPSPEHGDGDGERGNFITSGAGRGSETRRVQPRCHPYSYAWNLLVPHQYNCCDQTAVM